MSACCLAFVSEGLLEPDREEAGATGPPGAGGAATGDPADLSCSAGLALAAGEGRAAGGGAGLADGPPGVETTPGTTPWLTPGAGMAPVEEGELTSSLV